MCDIAMNSVTINIVSFVVNFFYTESSRKSVDSNNFNLQTFTGLVLVSVAA